MSDKFTSAEELKEVFEIAGHSEYVNFAPLTKEVGFSVQRLYKTERIDVFGYSASKNVIGTFCTLVLSAFFLFKITGGSPSLVKTIAENNVLALAASILTIAILDHLLPRGLLWLINMTIRLRWKIMLAKVTFK